MYRGSFGIKIELAKTSLHFASIHLRHSDTGNNGNIVINVHIKSNVKLSILHGLVKCHCCQCAVDCSCLALFILLFWGNGDVTDMKFYQIS